MAGQWTWDETLYAGSAPFYAAGRMPYPAALARRLAQVLRLDGAGRLLDVGCGPGSLTLLLAPLFARAVGVDADPGMIEQATAAAVRTGVGNVAWRRLRGEDLPAELGPVDVVTFAQSFHWMRRAEVAATVRDMLAPGGACVHVGATTDRGVAGEDRLRFPRPPRGEIDALVRAYLGPVRRAGRSRLPDGPASGETEIFRAAGFDGPEVIEVPRGEIVTRTIDDVVAATFSLSSATPHLFGDRREDFERELRALLSDAAEGGRFSERMRDITASVWR